MKKLVALLLSVFLVVTFTQAATLTIVQSEGTVTMTRPAGSRVTFKSLEDGIIKWWKAINGGVEVEDGGFDMPNGNVTVEAMYTGNVITVTQTTGGKISPGSVGVESNGSKTFTITPNAGYEINDVLVDGSSVKNNLVAGTGEAKTYTFTNVTAPHTITATYSIKSYTITATAGSGGTITPTSASVLHGGSKTFTIAQNEGYVLSELKVDGNAVTTALSYTVTNVQKDTIITASFSPISYTISYNLDGGTASNQTSYTIETESFTLNQPTKDGYTFTGWTGSNGTTAQTSVTIAKGSTGDKSYTANWEEAWAGWNAPVINSTKMVPVKWNSTYGKWETTTINDSSWYDYNSVAENESNGTVAGNGNGKWANIMTLDGLTYYNTGNSGTTTTPTTATEIPSGKIIATQGSQYVWIPRYTYKITSGYNSSGNSWNADLNPGTNKIEIKFSNGITDNNTDSYLSHPAFTFGNTQLKGIWVAKYEASRNDATESSTGSGTTVSSKPGVVSWRSLSVSNAFDYAYNLNRDLDSHLMKNVEWGAVAYLTNAIGRIPYINNSRSYITGNAGATQNAAQAAGTTDVETGLKASTTHNVYGIYDMSGGSWEYVAAYYAGGDSTYLSGDTTNKTYAGSLYTAANNTETAKYVDKYDTAYTSTKLGDAVYETSNAGSGNTSWDGDYSGAPTSSTPVFERGSTYSNTSRAGIFSFNSYNGDSGSYYGFRPCLAIP